MEAEASTIPTPKKSPVHKYFSLPVVKASARAVLSTSDLDGTFTTLDITKIQLEFYYIFPSITHHLKEGNKYDIYYDNIYMMSRFSKAE